MRGRVLETIRKRQLMRAGDRVAVAVSGGADSVALLVVMHELRSELGIVLTVAHVNHQLRGAESDEDERFVAQLARELHLEMLAKVAPVVRAERTGTEAAARELRYEFFRELAQTGRVNKIATAHTLDDQAETVLLRIFRGAGIRGLAGILPRFTIEQDGRACGEVVRPLLGVRREELRQFLRERGQSWREDSSNESAAFLRNRLRQTVIPVLRETFGESALENLADLAEIARAEEEACTQYRVASTPNSPLELRCLLSLPLAGRRRMVRSWMEATAPATAISFRVIEEILELAEGTAGRRLELAGGRVLRVVQGKLCWEEPGDTADYEYLLPVPGVVEAPELSARIEAVLTRWNAVPEECRDQLIDPQRIKGEMRIRNWRAGDRYWPANRKAAKKVKDLLTERHAVGAEKKLWPVVEMAGELVWMHGFGTPEAVHPVPGAQRVLWVRISRVAG